MTDKPIDEKTELKDEELDDVQGGAARPGQRPRGQQQAGRKAPGEHSAGRKGPGTRN